MQKLIFSLGLIVFGLISGYFLQLIIRDKVDQHDLLLRWLRKSLQRFAMLGLMPVAFIGAFWIIPFGDRRITLLPIVGSSMLLLGGVLGLGAANLLKRTGSQKSVMFCCGSFSNIASFGGLTSFYFFGEKGFALLALYKLFQEFVYYGIGFPVARYLRFEEEHLEIRSRVLEVFKDPFFLVAGGSFLIGTVLNLSGIDRPAGYDSLISILVPIALFLVVVSVGLGMRFSNVRNYIPEGAALFLIKFIILPLVGATVAYFLGLHNVQDGLPMKIVLIATSMPVAFNALIAASIYDMDLELANACWLITTCSMLLVLPWLYFLFSMF
jgi:predicted permease